MKYADKTIIKHIIKSILFIIEMIIEYYIIHLFSKIKINNN